MFGKKKKVDENERALKKLYAHSKKRKTKVNSATFKSRIKASSIQDLIAYKFIFDDGIICVDDNVYSCVIAFDDVNFRGTTKDQQYEIFSRLSDIYNAINDCDIQLLVINQTVQKNASYDDLALPVRSEIAELAEVYNEYMYEVATGIATNHTKRYRYFALSCLAENHDEARLTLSNSVRAIKDTLDDLRCENTLLNGSEVTNLLAKLFMPNEETNFDLAQLHAQGVTSKDAFCPSFIDFQPEGANSAYFKCIGAYKSDNELSDEMYYYPLQFKNPFPQDMDTSIANAITSLPYSLCMTLHLHPIDKNKAISMVEKKYRFSKEEEKEFHRKMAKQNLNGALFVDPKLIDKQDTTLKIRNELKTNNLFEMCWEIVVWDTDLDRLKSKVNIIKKTVAQKQYRLVDIPRQLKQALNTMLPLGVDYMDWHRYMLTSPLAMIEPFVAYQIDDKDGIFYGLNRYDNSPIKINRKRFSMPHGFVTGTTGSGKSVATRMELTICAATYPDDRIMLIDPKGENIDALARYPKSEIIKIAPGGKDCINLFDINTSYSADGGDAIAYKANFIIAFITSLLGDSIVNPVMKSLIDNAVRLTYQAAIWENERQEEINRDLIARGKRAADLPYPNNIPTLKLFHKILLKLEHPQAQQLYLALDTYVNGSLSIFSGQTNVNTDARIVCIDMQALSGELTLSGQLVILDFFWNVLTKNREDKRRTWIYIDECQNFLNSEAAMRYFTKFWTEGRSYGAIITGITQDIARIATHTEAKYLLSNSGFIYCLNQAREDVVALQSLFNLSDDQVNMIQNVKPGYGLIQVNGVMLPFANVIPKTCRLYRWFDTDPNA